MRPNFATRLPGSFTPVNLGILVTLVLSFLLFWLGPLQSMVGQLAFLPSDFSRQPWTAVTYPFLFPSGGFALLSLLFSGLWLYQIGGQVERQLGSWKYLATLMSLSVLGAVFVYLGYLIWVAMGQSVSEVLAGPYILLAIITICWATRDPMAPVSFFGVIPLQARWLGWLSALFVFFGTPPQLALFAAMPLVLAWLFASDRLPGLTYSGIPSRKAKEKSTGKHPKEDEGFIFEAEKRKREREERERLRKLFESSLRDDDPR